MPDFTYPYPRAVNTADVVLFMKRDQRWHVLLIKRAQDPFKDHWAFPGGHLEMSETLMACATRELLEETGIKAPELVQWRTISTPERGPRGRYITTVYYGFYTPPEGSVGDPTSSSDAASAEWVNLDGVKSLPLAFDHGYILFLLSVSLQQLLPASTK